jgi:hypothetical protein
MPVKAVISGSTILIVICPYFLTAIATAYLGTSRRALGGIGNSQFSLIKLGPKNLKGTLTILQLTTLLGTEDPNPGWFMQ